MRKKPSILSKVLPFRLKPKRDFFFRPILYNSKLLFKVLSYYHFNNTLYIPSKTKKEAGNPRLFYIFEFKTSVLSFRNKIRFFRTFHEFKIDTTLLIYLIDSNFYGLTNLHYVFRAFDKSCTHL